LTPVYQRQLRTRYHRPSEPCADASPVRRIELDGVQVLQLGELPIPTPSNLPMHEPT
jgi:hypothetical protein